MEYSGEPCIHSSSPAALVTLNWPSCAKKITIAKPFTKPSITGCGTRRINLPNLNTPAIICSIPVSTTVANRYCSPILSTGTSMAFPIALPVDTRATITTAIAPVAPEIIPGRPPNTAVIKPTIKAAYKPTNGPTPATKAKAIASGTNAKATVRPDSTSFFRLDTLLAGSSNIIISLGLAQYLTPQVNNIANSNWRAGFICLIKIKHRQKQASFL